MVINSTHLSIDMINCKSVGIMEYLAGLSFRLYEYCQYVKVNNYGQALCENCDTLTEN